MSLKDISIDNLPSTSFLTLKKFKKIGINNFFDLLNYFPFRYEDYRIISKINLLQPGEKVTVTSRVIDQKMLISKTGKKIFIFTLADETGKIEVSFYNQPYLLNVFKRGEIISLAGTVENFGRKIIFSPKDYEVGPPEKHTGRIIPVYSETYGLSTRTIREKIYFILKSQYFQELKEILPEKIIKENKLIDEVDAYKQIHYPDSFEKMNQAKKRLAFDELFFIQLSSFLVKKEWEKEKVGKIFTLDKEKEMKIEKFIKNLPFELTESQKKVWQEIFYDLCQNKPMNRLLQGDVGSGKTVVAALASYFAYLNQSQTLIMAPTEILAFQHYQTIKNLFKNYPEIKISLITSSSKKKKEDFKSDIVIGTHALIAKKASFTNAGLVIVDEQHRFGVAQRKELKRKGVNPHLLTMTATPIPRTVALTLYAELDISIISQMPKNRLQVKTFYVENKKRNDAYQWIKKQIRENQAQVFVVCPLIEESDKETLKSVKAAEKEFLNLKKIFSEFKIALLHGRMKAKEKEKIINQFRNKESDILVTTPVIEVGVDIPSATIILIEAAERFGLAQLHQLRGRVGRGDKQSYCLLFSEKQNPSIKKRLMFFAQTTSGLKLAEKDLSIRGPGDIFGTKQHGYLELKVASLTDFDLIEKVKNEASYFTKNYLLSDFPKLKERLDLEKIKMIDKS